MNYIRTLILIVTFSIFVFFGNLQSSMATDICPETKDDVTFLRVTKIGNAQVKIELCSKETQKCSLIGDQSSYHLGSMQAAANMLHKFGIYRFTKQQIFTAAIPIVLLSPAPTTAQTIVIPSSYGALALIGENPIMHIRDAARLEALLKAGLKDDTKPGVCQNLEYPKYFLKHHRRIQMSEFAYRIEAILRAYKVTNEDPENSEYVDLDKQDSKSVSIHFSAETGAEALKKALPAEAAK